ncbi:MAG: hypothetical protein MUE91_00745 [Ignavibacteriaceae bacterium]|jgi:hypothetical protein|nr:hypothetical protein [Ignavibacteriaceae bacterium]
MRKEIIEELALENSNPCVTISLNTHRTKPDNKKDRILLKNLCKQAESRLITEFGIKLIAPLLAKLDKVSDEIDISLNLDSLHIFLSNKTKEIIKSSWPVKANTVHIANSFALRPLIYALNRTEEYLILLLSQSGVHLYRALNDSITEEVKNSNFPFSQNIHFHTDSLKISDPKAVDNMVREFLNKVDKAIGKVNRQTGLYCIAICTEDNFSRLMQVADNPALYMRFANINYNNTANHFISAQAWALVKKMQGEKMSEAVKEIRDAAAVGNVYTDLQEIYRAVKEGRGDLLITDHNYYQAVKMKGEFSFELIQDVTIPGVIDDIISNISWEIISKNGRVLFTENEDLKELGNIVLKVRY